MATRIEGMKFWEVSVFDIQKFCQNNGYCVCIEDGCIWVEKEY